MKYGIQYHVGFSDKSNASDSRLISVGDVLENLAVKRIYRRMGVPEDQIVECLQYEVQDYKGEYLVLPINIYSLNVRFSRRILPVFLGLTIGGHRDLSEQEVNTLRRFAPVGCRDEKTMRRLLDLGIDAYLQGCLVATFPKRTPNPDTQKKVFFVNPEAGIRDYIPDELLENYEFFSHDYYMSPEEMSGDQSLYDFGQGVLDMYAREARLIVTSKYHAALAALALGIPVVLVMENCYFKYTWIKEYIPVYEPKDYPNINWDPDPVVIPDEEKELMLGIACDRIRETVQKYARICRLSEIREDIGNDDFPDIFYGTYAIEHIRRSWPKDEPFDYAMWGATQTAVTLHEFISENYPNARLRRIYDYAVQDRFLGLDPAKPTQIPDDPDYFVLVTGNSAADAARDLFARIGKSPDRFFCCERKVLQEADLADRGTRRG